MADSLNTPTLSKLHQSLSRRTLMREMAAGVAIAAIPASAIAAPQQTARERLSALIEELKIVAREDNPAICDWRVSIANKPGEMGCALLIAAFEPDLRLPPAAYRRSKKS